MATLNLVTSEILTANKVRVELFKQPDDVSAIDTKIVSAVGGLHPQRSWTFTDLIPSESYIFKISELNASTNAFMQYLFDPTSFTVPAAGSIKVHPNMDVQVDQTAGFVSGTSVAVLDGTNGAADLRGWEMKPNRTGYGFLHPDEYTWDVMSGTLTLLNDVTFAPDEYFYLIFEPQVIPAPVVTRDTFTAVMVADNNTAMVAGDVGKLVLIQGAVTYLEVTLPDINTVPERRLTYFESATGNHKNAAVVSANGNNIEWLEGGRSKIYFGLSESLAMYRHGSSWRVCNAEGNFKTVGQHYSTYADAEDQMNAVELNGAFLSVSEYARLYNDYVLKQSPAQLVEYADWGTGTNRYRYSKESGGLFRVPDLRGLYSRNIDTGYNPGDYLDSQNLEQDIDLPIWADDPTAAFKTKTITARRLEDFTRAVTGTAIHVITLDGGDEARPNSVIERRFVLT